MSDEPSLRDLNPFHQDPHPFPYTTPLDNHHQLGFADPPSSYMSFTDYLQGSMEYNHLSNGQKQPPVEGENNRSETLNSSSVSSSSTEAGGCGGGGGGEIEEDSERSRRKSKEMKASADENQPGGEDSNNKKGGKGKKKGEKKEKEPRISFMTKSEVDHLEDGYRWRKYGQKAVKNSPYPRSYYRCTTQKCNVKKRVERSFQDPSIVITTYEGQHNHHVPATLRGHASGVFSHSLFTAPPGFHQNHQADLLLQMATHGGRRVGSPLVYNFNNTTTTPQPTVVVHSSSFPADQQQQNLSHLRQQIPDYGLLQDMVPSFLLKQEP